MESTNSTPIEPRQPRLRAFVEIVDGELKIFPIADSDADERRILKALKFVREALD
jgi:hypothetical protein